MQQAKYQPVIGIEVHVEPKTQSKMFCSCSADYFGRLPNSQVCPVCLGLPGTLPVPNKKAIEMCIKLGLALGSRINTESKFDRKHYFYPDLPKGYQISQYDKPFCEGGSVTYKSNKLRIRRVHMEEDTAKLMHESNKTLIDFNRSGVPLVEIVSEPDISSPGEAKLVLQNIRQIIRYMEISDADMEKGTMRCEVNISLRRQGDRRLPSYKVEIKNLNSFRSVEKALEYEVTRQAKLLSIGKAVDQETRGWEERGITVSQRMKEEAQDYRYFPEPDIPIIHISEELVKEIAATLPELPDQRLLRFIGQYGLTEYDAEILTREHQLAEYFERVVRVGERYSLTPRKIANVLVNQKINREDILPADLVHVIVEENRGTIIAAEEFNGAIQEVLKEHGKAVSDFEAGKQEAIDFLIGQVQRRLKKKVNHKDLREKLLVHLKKT